MLQRIEKKNKDKITRIRNNGGDYHDAIKARKEINKTRQRFIKLSLILMAVISTVVVIFQADSSESVLWLGLGVFFFSIFFLSLPILQGNSIAESMIGNIASETIEDAFASEKPFYLFLRMFKADDREKSVSEVKRGLYLPGFSEYYFVKGLKKEVGKVFAVGDPREVDAPYGAERIYLPLDRSGQEDGLDKWQEDILRLMEKAGRIYVMIANTESCLWELEQALSLYPQKTIYIVCDVNENDYNAVRKAGIGDFPDLYPCNGWFCHMLQKNNDDNTWIINRYKKTASGYKRISNTSTGKLSWLRYFGVCFLSLASLAFIFFIAGKEFNKRSEDIRLQKECRQFWSSKEQVDVDSVLVVQQCSFDKNGLVINAMSTDPTITITKVQAETCFFALAGYDIITMKECLRILKKDKKPLRIIVKDDTGTRVLCQYEYTSDDVIVPPDELLKKDNANHSSDKGIQRDSASRKHSIWKSGKKAKLRTVSAP